MKTCNCANCGQEINISEKTYIELTVRNSNGKNHRVKVCSEECENDILVENETEESEMNVKSRFDDEY